VRIAILTTDTIHHRYFLSQLESSLPYQDKIVLNIFEEAGYPWGKRAWRYFIRSLPNLWNSVIGNPYLDIPFLKRRQAKVELRHFFCGEKEPPLSAAFPTANVDTINDPVVLKLFEKYEPDIGVVYGTSKIKSDIFSWPRLGLINAHGGLLPQYRGLDTNLWACANGTPEDMGVTIHRVAEGLDTGEIFISERLHAKRGLNLSNLRLHTTIFCTSLIVDVLKQISDGRSHSELQSISDGRYFGPIPIGKKIIAGRHLRRFASQQNG